MRWVDWPEIFISYCIHFNVCCYDYKYYDILHFTTESFLATVAALGWVTMYSMTLLWILPCYSGLYCFVLYCIGLSYHVFYDIALNFTLLQWIILFCIVLQWVELPLHCFGLKRHTLLIDQWLQCTHSNQSVSDVQGANCVIYTF